MYSIHSNFISNETLLKLMSVKVPPHPKTHKLFIKGLLNSGVRDGGLVTWVTTLQSVINLITSVVGIEIDKERKLSVSSSNLL